MKEEGRGIDGRMKGGTLHIKTSSSGTCIPGQTQRQSYRQLDPRDSCNSRQKQSQFDTQAAAEKDLVTDLLGSDINK